MDAMRPAVVCDEKGNRVLIEDATSTKAVEDLARAAVTTMGSNAAFVPAPLRGEQIKAVAIPNAFSQAWRLGRTVLAARASQSDPVAAVTKAENGRVLFVGKVTDVTRKTSAGFVRGDLIVTEMAEDEEQARECTLHFQVPLTSCLPVVGASPALTLARLL